jgi:hypothetical protein
MSLQLHKPDGRGGIEPRDVRGPDWRRQLRSPRWGSARRDERLPELKNPEVNPTPRWLSVLAWAGLAVLTFVILLLGYGTGFWKS